MRIHHKNYVQLDGSTKNQVERVGDGSIIERFAKTDPPREDSGIICPHFLNLKWGNGCHFDCAWCYLKGTYRHRPEGTKFKMKDPVKIVEHIKCFLSEVEEPEILNSGEVVDSLASEGDEGKEFSKLVQLLFESQDKHKLLYLTKSTAIKNLLELPHNQTIVSFSVNSWEVSRTWEHGAPPSSLRVESAMELFKKGYEVRIRIDPMVPVKGWKAGYMGLLDFIFANLKPERITLGSLRGLKTTLQNVKDKSWIEYLSENSGWGKKIDFQTRFLMYSTIISYLRDKYDFYKVALCKETLRMWLELEREFGEQMNYKKIKCNCLW